MKYDDAVRIDEDIYWIGWYKEEAPLRSNSYLIKDESNSGTEVILIDPGSATDFPIVLRKITQVCDLKDIKYIILHHQDPDICASVPKLEEILINLGCKLKIITHSRAWFLIPFYGIKSEYYLIDFKGWKLELNSGRILRFIFTPYLHFPGAFVTYDTKTRTLFSSDLFGAITYEFKLYEDKWYEEAMKAFHEHYMSHEEHLRIAMEKLEKIHKKYGIKRICPQHGSIIEGEDKVSRYINILKNITCGKFSSIASDMEWLEDNSNE